MDEDIQVDEGDIALGEKRREREKRRRFWDREKGRGRGARGKDEENERERARARAGGVRQTWSDGLGKWGQGWRKSLELVGE